MKELSLEIKVATNETDTSFTFSDNVSTLESIAFWVMVKDLAEKQIWKTLNHNQ